ncbi:bifunctional metallophosphatase/5'-nucleotidase [Archangium violaceum]|uniref:bifunctional metallophosphatase/5'-nucleotidase n=1 Tax=Archangium violaceum TaxID=83451 RepID=UPI00193BCBCE|nr:bifunctional metallophosphatase/5'-nucleotidase [Archangium violaceum]QRK04379.1 bifunctional metallophosphatase/5'-nucleotidase [Archangium violaceum]
MHLLPTSSTRHPKRSSTLLLLGALFSGSLLVLDSGCGEEKPKPPPENRQVRLQLLAINDFHGNLEKPTGSNGRIEAEPSKFVDAGGAAYLAHHISKLREENPHTVVVSAGDLIGASPLTSALFHDEPTIEAMNQIGLDINSVGNHEFDEGFGELLRMQSGGCHPVDGCQDGTPFSGAKFKFLSANVFTDTVSRRTLLPAYDIREFDGVKVAFIGMTLEGTPGIVTPTGIAGLSFHDEADTVNALIPELHEQGVKAVVVVLHEGGSPTGRYNECPGISGPIVDIVNRFDPEVDLVVSGHTHQAYTCVINGKHVTSAASNGRLVTDIDLVLDAASGDVVETTARNVIVTRETADTAVEALVNDYVTKSAPLRDKVIGNTPADLKAPVRPLPAGGSGESVLGNVIADAMLAATSKPETGGAVIALMNPGGVRADIAAGDITYGEVFTVQPFANNLVTMTLTGAQIERVLEQQFPATGSPSILQVSEGFSFTWKASGPQGDKIDPASITLNGVPLDMAASYRVTTNNFMAAGGDGLTALTEGKELRTGPIDVDALEVYLRANSPLTPPGLGRISVTP